MMKRNVVVFAVMLMLFGSVQATAVPLLQGATGLISIPTAYILGENTVGVKYFYSGGTNNIILNVGYNNRVEFGLTYAPPMQLDEIQAHIKATLLAERAPWPALAVGVINKSPFAVMSRNIGVRGLRIHLGYGGSELQGPFVGVEQDINPISITQGFHLPLATMQAEYSQRGLNFGLVVEPLPELGIKVKASLLALKEAAFGLEYSYSF